MATIQFTQNVQISVCVEVPDSQLKAYLAALEDDKGYDAPYLKIDPSPIELTKKSKTEIDTTWDDYEIELIERDNGNTYDWDGDTLNKQ